MRFVTLTVVFLAFFTIAHAQSFETSQLRPENESEFNKLNREGNIAAMKGQFKAAIGYWEKAIPLDKSRVVECRGESLKTRIQAANDALQQVQERKLSESNAPKWFQEQSTTLWMRHICNLP
jgi:hypothetical protein